MTLNKVEEAYIKALNHSDGFSNEYFICNIYGKPLKFGSTFSSILVKHLPVVPDKVKNKYSLDENEESWEVRGYHVDYSKSINNILKLPDIVYFYPGNYKEYIINDDFCLNTSERDLYIYSDQFPEYLFDCIVYDIAVVNIQYITGITNAGVNTITRAIKTVNNKEILDNYNDDLPNNEILKFLKGTESGLIVLRSNPGLGKTYLIRSWISELSDFDFITMDINDFSTIVHNKQYLDVLEGKILILEDCEELLKDRNRSAFNTTISNLLNMTDGLFGDFLNFKVICTLNTDLSNIDKALLRKGRIKVLYELKPLSQNKADALRKKLGKSGGTSNALCDIYNEDSTGVVEQQKVNKIGF